MFVFPSTNQEESSILATFLTIGQHQFHAFFVHYEFHNMKSQLSYDTYSNQLVYRLAMTTQLTTYTRIYSSEVHMSEL